MPVVKNAFPNIDNNPFDAGRGGGDLNHLTGFNPGYFVLFTGGKSKQAKDEYGPEGFGF